jgi:hypothetical protein
MDDHRNEECLSTFLDHHRTSEGEAESHTSYSGGKYVIPLNENDRFLELYTRAIRDGNFPTLNECILPGCKFIFYMDLDFPDHEFIDIIRHHNSIPTDFDFHARLRNVVVRVIQTMTENNPRVIYLSKQNSPHKIHIYAPTLLCNTKIFACEVLKKARDAFFEEFRIRENVQLMRYQWDKIFDAAPYTNGLRMPGSCKRSNDVADRYGVLDLDGRDGDDGGDGTLELTVDRLRDMTIRLEVGADDSIQCRPGCSIQSENEEIPVAALHCYVAHLRETQFFGTPDKHPLYIHNITRGFMPATFIVNLKDRYCPFIDRSHVRTTRFMYLLVERTGCRIKCYDEDCKLANRPSAPLTPAMQHVFEGFKTVSLYVSEQESLQFARLGMKLSISQSSRILMDRFTGTDFGLAELFYDIFKDVFRVDRQSKREVQWYIFRDHRFSKADDDVQLAIAPVMTTLLRLFVHERYPEYFTKNPPPPDHEAVVDNAIDVEDDANAANGEDLSEGDLDRNRVLSEKEKKKKTDAKTYAFEMTCKIIRKLEGPSSNSVLIKAASMFVTNDKSVGKKFDAHPHLLGFENGVLDFSNKFNPVFRPGRLDDYITLSTGYDFKHLSLDDPYVTEVLAFFESVWPSESKRTFALTAFSKCLTAVQIERLYSLCGSGSNAKSKIVKLLGLAFGGYWGDFPIAVLTQKRGGGGSAAPELVALKGIRVATTQEPDTDSTLNVGYVFASLYFL